MKLKNNNLFNHLQFNSGALNVIWTFLFFQQFCNQKWRMFYHVNTDTCNSYWWYNFTLKFPENGLQKYWKPLKQEPFENAYPHNASDLNFLPAVYIIMMETTFTKRTENITKKKPLKAWRNKAKNVFTTSSHSRKVMKS